MLNLSPATGPTVCRPCRTEALSDLECRAIKRMFTAVEESFHPDVVPKTLCISQPSAISAGPEALAMACWYQNMMMQQTPMAWMQAMYNQQRHIPPPDQVLLPPVQQQFCCSGKIHGPGGRQLCVSSFSTLGGISSQLILALLQRRSVGGGGGGGWHFRRTQNLMNSGIIMLTSVLSEDPHSTLTSTPKPVDEGSRIFTCPGFQH
jgi:hypothetical protein